MICQFSSSSWFLEKSEWRSYFHNFILVSLSLFHIFVWRRRRLLEVSKSWYHLKLNLEINCAFYYSDVWYFICYNSYHFHVTSIISQQNNYCSISFGKISLIFYFILFLFILCSKSDGFEARPEIQYKFVWP